jgi:protein phosphatase
VRYQWAADYRGSATVVYGHTPVPEPEWLNNTINIDTGCVFGGKLTALRYPERELVSVKARAVYCQPVKPFLAENEELSLTAQQEDDDVLDLDDVLGKRLIDTKFKPRIMIRSENARAALEVMSRFAANPKWLIYLPPTMSPAFTSSNTGLLEHPQEAFVYYQCQGVPQVICEEKHMGSRAIAIVCRDEGAAQRRFGVVGEGIGICYTRTGRHFFQDLELETQFLQRLGQALSATDFWQKFNTDWVCLDCELMPWSVKAQQLLQQQYASVGIAAEVSLSQAVELLQQAATNGVDVSHNLTQYQQRHADAQKYVQAYRGYCWQVKELSDLKLAPFHLLATENAVHADRDHLWHLQNLAEICRADTSLLVATPYRVVNLHDATSLAEAIDWWSDLTNAGGEGIVVKPFDFIAKKQQSLIQPALKCRGREYLRIIYGPEYTTEANLEQLRRRRLSRKRSLAMREFCLGIEALERFISRQPLRRVHECVFGILALESEPIDPRL